MRIKLGIFFITFAVVFFVFSLIPTFTQDSQAVLDILEKLYCEPGDNLSAKQIVNNQSNGTSYSADYACMDKNERTYDVSNKAFGFTMAGFVVPLVLGVFFLIAGASQLNDVK